MNPTAYMAVRKPLSDINLPPSSNGRLGDVLLFEAHWDRFRLDRRPGDLRQAANGAQRISGIVDIGAVEGTLSIMIGGEEEDFERARPLFDVMGALVLHVGGLGQGEMVKLINNATAAANTAPTPSPTNAAGNGRLSCSMASTYR